MVLLLILIFGDSDLPLVAAVWAMMAFGDPAATIAGRLVGGPALPWNRDKTWVGLLADWAVAGSTSVAVFSFVIRQPPRPEAVLVLMLGAGLYAFLESVRSGLDDNIVAALPTALAVYAMGTRGAPAWIAAASGSTLLIALAVNVVVALLMGALRVVSVSGAVAGAVAGFLILAAGGWGAYGLLWTFFLAGTLATKLGYRRKAAAGLAQGNAGPPGSGERRRELPRSGGAAAARPAVRRVRRRLRRRAGRHARHGGRHALRPAGILAARLPRAAGGDPRRDLVAGHRGEPGRGRARGGRGMAPRSHPGAAGVGRHPRRISRRALGERRERFRAAQRVFPRPRVRERSEHVSRGDAGVAHRAGMRRYVRLARPFTLLPPLVGIVSGAICAFGSAHNPDPARRVTWAVVVTVAIGSLCASAMNAASNVVNQIADLEIDRKNKPERPLVTGEIGIPRAWVLAAVLYVLSIVPTWLVVPYPHESFSERLAAPLHLHAAFFIYCVGALATFVYSFRAFGRTKRHWFAANFTIAVTRGGLLKVAGWSFVASVLTGEAWAIGGIFALFLLGATSTKDFSDMEGDRAHGCITLPVRFGVARAAKIMAPFFVVPWLLIPVFTWLPGDWRLTGNRVFLTTLGLVLAAWGTYTASLLLRDPESLASTENHPAWTHMYLMMICAQVGFAVGYLV